MRAGARRALPHLPTRRGGRPGPGRGRPFVGASGELPRRLPRIFLKDASGRRPVLAYHPKLHDDPHFRDLVLFHEYFHGDTGRGVGASHQTGGSGLVAKLLHPRTPDPPAAGATKAEKTTARRARKGATL